MEDFERMMRVMRVVMHEWQLSKTRAEVSGGFGAYGRVIGRIRHNLNSASHIPHSSFIIYYLLFIITAYITWRMNHNYENKI